MKNYIVILESGGETDPIRRMVIELRAESRDAVREIVESTITGPPCFIFWRWKNVTEVQPDKVCEEA